MECSICLESDPPPIQSGCACRGDAGLAHAACRAQAAVQGPRGFNAWRECQTCKQRFTGAMERELAEAWCARTSELAETSTERRAARGSLAISLSAFGELAESRRVTISVHAASREALGDDHPSTLVHAFNLGFARLVQDGDPRTFARFGHGGDGHVTDAERIFREIMRAARDMHDEHERAYFTLAGQTGLGACHLGRGEHDKGARALSAAHEGQLRLLGANNELTVATAYLLATARAISGAPMVRELKETVRTQSRTLGPDHPDTLATRTLLAHSMRADDIGAAERELRDVLCAYRRTVGDGHVETIRVLRMLVRLTSETKRVKGLKGTKQKRP